MTTRRTYELPIPTNTHAGVSVWFTGHPVDINGDFIHDGSVIHRIGRRLIDLQTHDGQYLDLNYADAQRVALALLAAVEEANTRQENQ